MRFNPYLPNEIFLGKVDQIEHGFWRDEEMFIQNLKHHVGKDVSNQGQGLSVNINAINK